MRAAHPATPRKAIEAGQQWNKLGPALRQESSYFFEKK